MRSGRGVRVSMAEMLTVALLAAKHFQNHHERTSYLQKAVCFPYLCIFD